MVMPDRFSVGGFSRRPAIALLSAVIITNLWLAGCASRPAAPPDSGARQVKETQTGLASFYHRRFHGEETAGGETFNNYAPMAAHPTYPLDTIVRVTNEENGRAVEVRIADRGPSEENQREGVIIDLSRGTAAKLGMVQDGRVRVKVEVLEGGQGK
jgi:rare lipoprotein A